VADGGDPAVAFASLASAYGASPMAWAYKARAGTDGPGYMIGSGVGAVLAVAAVAVPLAMGASNKALAEDLGVKPEEPPPELVPTTAPKRPVTTTKPPKPKKDPKEDPKDTPPKEDPKEDPIVEPTRPLPPKPTPDPTGKRVPKRIGKGLGKGEK
jgi:protein TonB